MFIQDQATFSIATSAVNPGDLTAAFSDGFLSETLVDTATGWKPAGMLSAGESVHTFDGGLRKIARVERRFFNLNADADAPECLIRVSGGFLNACSDAIFMPDQRVMIETPTVEALTGAPTALVRIGDLCGLNGISLVRPVGMQQIVRPVFADEEILWANTGLMCHFGGARKNGHPKSSPFFAELSRKQARLAVFGQCQTEIRPLCAA